MNLRSSSAFSLYFSMMVHRILIILKKYAYRFKPRVINSYFLYRLVAPNYGLLPPNDSFFRANDSLPAANNRTPRATLAVVWKKLRILQSWVKAWMAPAIPYYMVVNNGRDCLIKVWLRVFMQIGLERHSMRHGICDRLHPQEKANI